MPDVSCDCCDNVMVGKKIKVKMRSHLGGEKDVHYCRNCASHMILKCHCCGQWYKKPDNQRKRGVVLLSAKIKENDFDTRYWNCVYSDYEYLDKYISRV